MRHKGQSLIEVLIGLGLIAFFVVAGAGIIAPSLRTNGQAAQVQAKAQLGNELLQNVSAWAAGNWNGVLSLATGTSNHYYLDDTVSPFAVATGNQNKVIKDTFTRFFYLDDVYRDVSGGVTSTASGNSYDPSTKRVTVVVQNATSTGALVPITYVSYLIRAVNNVFNQTSWSGNPNQASPITLTNGSFATSSNLAGAAPSSIEAPSGTIVTYTSAGVMTTYNGIGGNPVAIAFDGVNMWTANGDGSVTKISPTGATTTYTGVGSTPVGIAFDGTSMWVANGGYPDYGVTKINISTGATTTYTDIDVAPSGIAYDGAGNMWVTSLYGGVVKLNISTGATSTFTGGAYYPNYIASDGAGNMWTASIWGGGGHSGGYDNHGVTKITSGGGMTTYDGTAYTLSGIASDGTNMWVSNYDLGTVTKVSPSGVMTTYSGVGNLPAAIASDGTNIWTANARGSITKISPSGVMTTYGGVFGMSASLSGIAFASSTNTIWVTDRQNNTATKFDPAGTVHTGAMVIYNNTGGYPGPIAFDGTNMWVGNQWDGTVMKISPTGVTTTYGGVPGYINSIAFASSTNTMWAASWIPAGNLFVTKVDVSTGAMTIYDSGRSGIPGHLAYDGTNMWVADGNTGVIKVSPDGVMTPFTIDYTTRAIAYDGTNMWVAHSYDGVTKLNISTGATTTYSTAPAAAPWAIAFDGTNMWVAQNGTSCGCVTKVSPTGVTTTYAGMGGNPYDIAFDGTNMWVATENGLTKISPSGVMAAYDGMGGSSLAYDGTNMWVVSGGSVTKFIELSSSGGGGTISLASSGGGYVASGTLDSATFDTGVAGGVQMNSFSWQGNANSSTAVKFQFAVSNSATGTWNYTGPSGDASTYFTGNPGAPVSLVGTTTGYAPFTGYRYFRYRITLFSDGARVYTPTVTGMAVNWSP